MSIATLLEMAAEAMPDRQYAGYLAVNSPAGTTGKPKAVLLTDDKLTS